MNIYIYTFHFSRPLVFFATTRFFFRDHSFFLLDASPTNKIYAHSLNESHRTHGPAAYVSLNALGFGLSDVLHLPSGETLFTVADRRDGSHSISSTQLFNDHHARRRIYTILEELFFFSTGS